MATLPTKESMRSGLLAFLNVPVSFMGLAFFRSWLSLLTHENLLVGLDGLAHDIVLAAVLLILALLATRISPISQRHWPLASATVLAVLSSAGALILTALNSSALNPVAGILLGSVAACASALFILLWCELYSRLDITKAALSLSTSFILAVFINVLLDGMIVPYRHVALIVLPLLSTACFMRATTVAPQSPVTTRNTKLRFPWQLLVLIAMYYLASGICMGTAEASSLVFKNISNALAGLLVLVPLTLFSGSFDLQRVLSSPLIVLVCVLLLLPFTGESTNENLVAVTTSLGAALFELAVFLLLCDISHRHRIPAVFLFGIEEAAAVFQSTGIAIGGRGELLASHGLSTSLLVITLVALTAVATLLFFKDSGVGSKWGVGVFGPGRISQEHEAQERVRQACALLTKQCGLTTRESEVLALLAAEKGISDICDELSIARGTAKAHCEHIYSKTGVRSKGQLLEKLEALATAQ